MNDSGIYYRELYYSGHVQGVGFRYTTAQIVLGYEVRGTVQNLTDGRVHLRVEGDRAEVEAFCKRVAEEMRGYIRGTEESDGYREPEMSGFHILH
jgi:acylphosphatase